MDPSAKDAWAAARPGTEHAIDSVCVAPWVSLEFDPAGWVYACCTSGMYPLGRIGEDRLRDLWGGPRAMVLREALERWDLSVACGPCRWHLEHERLDPVAAVYDRYPVERPDPATPFMMLFALSNRCNLGCVMCNPELSSTLRHEAGMAPAPSPYDDDFFEDLAPLLGELRLAKFLGGEPFLAPEHRRVWELMDLSASPPQLQITTNGTIWNDTVEWVMDRFQTDISISIDAVTASTYERIRRGGNHERLMRNVDRFDARCREQGTDLHVSYCLMESNAHELGDFLAWAERFEVPASVNLVTDLGLALHDLPLARLDDVRRRWASDEHRLDARLSINREVWNTQVRQLDSVIAERRAGVDPAPRQGHRARGPLFGEQGVTHVPLPGGWRRRRVAQAERSARIRDEMGQLERWSGGGPVAHLVADEAAMITEVRRCHPRLGVDDRVVGTALDDLAARLELADGRPAWIVDQDLAADRSVRTLVLSRQQPERGAIGSIVRIVQLRDGGGSAVLVAEDRIYDRSPCESGAAPAPVEVQVSGVRGNR